MIISNSNPIKNAAKLYGEQTKAAKSGSTAKTGPVQQKDEVILSPEAQEISLAQQALKDVARLNAEIADLREALSIQRAEWAYLNRPDRLRELSTINFDRLGLLPMQPEQFGHASQIAFPVVEEELPLIIDPVDVMGEQEPADQEVTP